MEINKIFSISYDFNSREVDICINSSGMNTVFDIPYNFRWRNHFDFPLQFYMNKKNEFSKVLLKSRLIMVHATTWYNFLLSN